MAESNLESLVEKWKGESLSDSEIQESLIILHEKFSEGAINDFVGLRAKSDLTPNEQSQLDWYLNRLSKLIGERRRLLGDFAKKFEDYERTGSRILDLSDLMRNQYVAEEQVRIWDENEDVDPQILRDLCVHIAIYFPGRKASIVDYGCGSGKKSAHMYKAMEAHGIEMDGIYLIDFSDEMLQKAIQTCVQQGIAREHIHDQKPIDLEGMVEFKELGESPRLHLFLGQTIGNFKDPGNVVRRIVANMKKGDCLLVEWFKKEPEDYEDKEDKRDKGFEFFYRRLLNDILGIPREAIGDYKPYKDEKWIRTLLGLPGWNVMPFYVQDTPAGTESWSFEIKGRKYSLKPNTEIIVSKSRRFLDRKVLRLFRKEGLASKPVGYIPEITKESYPPPGYYIFPLVVRKRGKSRYALFKRTRTIRPKTRRIATAGVLAGALVSAGLASFIHYLPTDCQEAEVEEYSVYCKRPQNKIPLYPSEGIWTRKRDYVLVTSQEDSTLFATVGLKNYRFEFREGEIESVIDILNKIEETKRGLERRQKHWQKIKEARKSGREERATFLMNYYNISCNPFSESVVDLDAYLSDCTPDLRVILSTRELVRRYNRANLKVSEKRVNKAIAKRAYQTRDPEKVLPLIGFFDNDSVFDLLRTTESSGEGNIESLIDYLVSVLEKKTIMETVEYYSSTISPTGLRYILQKMHELSNAGEKKDVFFINLLKEECVSKRYKRCKTDGEVIDYITEVSKVALENNPQAISESFLQDKGLCERKAPEVPIPSHVYQK